MKNEVFRKIHQKKKLGGGGSGGGVGRGCQVGGRVGGGVMVDVNAMLGIGGDVGYENQE